MTIILYCYTHLRTVLVIKQGDKIGTFEIELQSYGQVIKHQLVTDGKVTISILRGATDLMSETYNVIPICQGQKGKWYTDEQGRNHFQSDNCVLFENPNELLEGSAIHFLGNSHILNLFRCMSETIRGNVKSSAETEVDHDALSCYNMCQRCRLPIQN